MKILQVKLNLFCTDHQLYTLVCNRFYNISYTNYMTMN